MGLFDAFKIWRGGQAPSPAVPASPRPAQPSAPQARAPVPDHPRTEDAAEAASLPEAPLIHDDADADALERALDDDLYGGPERRRRPRLSARPDTKILIVDDSVTIVAVLRKMLQQNGYETLEAYTAEKAMELIEQQPPHLVFLDIVLPGMDGFNALRAMRRHPATKSVPIIMISGNAQATEQFYVQRIGADDFMKKPFTRAEVFARIERLLDEEGIPRRNGQQSAGNAASATQG